MNFTNLFKRRCLFCKKKEKLTNEHIIPLWLLTELDLVEKEMIGIHSSWFGLVKSQRKHKFSHLLNGLICEKCNTGWMSDLENAVRPILTPIMNSIDTNHAYQMLINNHELIAKWVFKTAMVLNYGTNYRKLIPSNHFYSLYKSEIPKGIYINLGIANKIQDNIWQQTQTLMVIGETQRINKRMHYKITFQFKHLLLRICYFPFDDFTLNHEVETSISLWPQFGIYNELKSYENLDDFAIKCIFVQISGSKA